MFTCRVQSQSPSVPGSAGTLCWGRAQAWAKRPELSSAASCLKAWRPSLLKRPILDLLPVQICLVPKAIFRVWGKTNTQRMHGSRLTLVLRFRTLNCNISARTQSFCYTRTQLENIKMNCCRLENQLGKKGKTSGVILRI